MSDNQTISKLEKGTAFKAYQYVEVSFREPNTYVRVYHDLNPENPYAVRYIVVGKDGDSVISDNRFDSASLDRWSKQYIVLKSNRAPSTAELLLMVKKDE